MKGWHVGLVVVFILGYVANIFFPQAGQWVQSKLS
jgi:hypothetical protein